jgi:hypothetical protein
MSVIEVTYHTPIGYAKLSRDSPETALAGLYGESDG